jgi:hypothetical protein
MESLPGNRLIEPPTIGLQEDIPRMRRSVGQRSSLCLGVTVRSLQSAGNLEVLKHRLIGTLRTYSEPHLMVILPEYVIGYNFSKLGPTRISRFQGCSPDPPRTLEAI